MIFFPYFIMQAAYLFFLYVLLCSKDCIFILIIVFNGNFQENKQHFVMKFLQLLVATTEKQKCDTEFSLKQNRIRR